MKTWAVRFQFNELRPRDATQSAIVEAGNMGTAIKRAYDDIRPNIKGKRINEALIGVKKIREIKNGGDT